MYLDRNQLINVNKQSYDIHCQHFETFPSSVNTIYVPEGGDEREEMERLSSFTTNSPTDKSDRSIHMLI